MKIGLIATELPPAIGGMSEVLTGLAQSLGSSDEVIVCCPEQCSPGTTDEIAQMPARFMPILTGDRKIDARRLSQYPVDAWLALNAGLSPLAPLVPQPFFAYFNGNDFLHPWLPYGPPLLERIRRPYVVSARRWLRQSAIRSALPAVRLVLAISNSTRALVAKTYSVAPEQLVVCPPGVRDEFFQNGRRPSDVGAGNPLRILTVSRLSTATPRKNIDGVLRALAILKGRIPLHYTIVGDGDDRPRLERLAGELELSSVVTFTGKVDLPALLRAYRRSDLFVLASRATQNDVEGFGIVYLEANASGVPVICSRAGGAVDAVHDGVNGILIPSSSPEDIAAGIERFVRERARFPHEAVRAFAEQFRWDRIAAKVRSLILSRV